MCSEIILFYYPKAVKLVLLSDRARPRHQHLALTLALVGSGRANRALPLDSVHLQHHI